MKYPIILRLFFLLLFLYFLAVNFHVPLSTDDYCMRASSSNFIGLIKSTYLMYMTWSGSIPIMFMQFFFLSTGKLGLFLANFVNAFCLCALIYLIFLFAFHRKPYKNTDIINLIFIVSLLWFTPNLVLGETSFWKVGSSYLWATTISLAFMYPYYQMLLGRIVLKDTWKWRVTYSFLGFLAGFGAANVILTVSAFVLFTVLYVVYKQKTFTWWSVLGYAFCLFGNILFFIAPGNYARNKAMQAMPLEQLHFIEKFYPFSAYLFYCIAFSLLLIGVILLLRFKLKLKPVLTYRHFCLLLILAFVSAYVLMGAPFTYYDPRVLFFSQILIIMATLAILPETYHFKRSIMHKSFMLFVLVLGCSLLVSMVHTYQFYQLLHQQELDRKILIQKAKSEGNLDLIVPAYYGVNPQNNFHINSGSLYSEDITVDKNNYSNRCFSKVYGLNSIAAENNAGLGAPTSRVPLWVLALAKYLRLNVSSVNHGLVN